MKKLLFITLFTFVSTLAFAGDKEDVKAFLSAFEKDLSELPKLKDKSIVKKYLASDVTFSATYVSTLGNIKTLFFQAPEVDRFLDSRMNSDLTYSTDIVSDVSFAVRNSVYVYTFETKYTVAKGSDVLLKGTRVNTYYIGKSGKSMKILKIVSSDTEDEKFSGTCLCQIYEGPDSAGEAIVKLKYPNGNDYKEELMTVKYKKNNNQYMVKVQGGSYVWNGTDLVVKLNENSSKKEKLGNASDFKEVIQLIMGKSIFVEACDKVILAK